MNKNFINYFLRTKLKIFLRRKLRKTTSVITDHLAKKDANGDSSNVRTLLLKVSTRLGEHFKRRLNDDVEKQSNFGKTCNVRIN